MYMGSSWPIIGDWKKDNPKAANTAQQQTFEGDAKEALLIPQQYMRFEIRSHAVPFI